MLSLRALDDDAPPGILPRTSRLQCIATHLFRIRRGVSVQLVVRASGQTLNACAKHSAAILAESGVLCIEVLLGRLFKLLMPCQEWLTIEGRLA
jgi:hypothetical protein